jgi:hypothetical protein
MILPLQNMYDNHKNDWDVKSVCLYSEKVRTKQFIKISYRVNKGYRPHEVEKVIYSALGRGKFSNVIRKRGKYVG